MARFCPKCRQRFEREAPVIAGAGWQYGDELRECPCGHVAFRDEWPTSLGYETGGARRQRAYFDMLGRLGLPFSLADYRRNVLEAGNG